MNLRRVLAKNYERLISLKLRAPSLCLVALVQTMWVKCGL